MPGLDLERIGESKTLWLSLGGAMQGVEVEVRYTGPKEQERWRQKLVRDGILRIKEGSHTINNNREGDFFTGFAEMYVTNWRGDIKPKDAPYDHKKMGIVLGAYSVAFNQISDLVGEETDFFSESGSDSTG